jgi:hypothetical protein
MAEEEKSRMINLSSISTYTRIQYFLTKLIF